MKLSDSKCLCQHLPSLLPTPANYSFTFRGTLYQGTPSHYSSQLAAAKGRLLRTDARRKVTPRRTLPQAASAVAPPCQRGPDVRVCQAQMSLRQVFTRPRGLGARIRTDVMYARVCGKGGVLRVTHKEDITISRCPSQSESSS